jgi:hypothetical protein
MKEKDKRKVNLNSRKREIKNIILMLSLEKSTDSTLIEGWKL